MSTRTLIRNVSHTIAPHPDTEITYEADCLGCQWSAEPSTDAAAVDVECLSHAGRSNHRGFRRIVTGFAFVVRAGEDPVPTPRVSPTPADG
ncbi:hypothetical protein ACIQM0_30480 [Streptomyces sp. NPDC091387]|uniref:DUF7848 domain-containing protein n=1 Tax=Streptomyces sp. NPDC091387 TaxID=3365998 RepID=UPI0038042973